MFKKTLAAAAILGAFAGSAFAADVTLYGVVDTGLSYQHSKVKGSDATDTFKMVDGQNAGSRFGLKGVEDLGNGVKVGFVLENGYNADAGTFDSNGTRMFGRQSTLFVDGAFGHVSFGRVGQIASGAGDYAVMSKISAFGTGIGNIGSETAVYGGTASRFDNMVTYRTPKFAGFQVTAQYSFDGNTQEDTLKVGTDDASHGKEGQSNVNRYYGVGATYQIAGLQAVVVVDSINYASGPDTTKTDDDALTVTAGVSYDFNVAKVYFGGQYFDHSKRFGKKAEISLADDSATVTGYGLNLSADIPVMGGTAKVGVGYGEGERDIAGDKPELKLYQASAAYVYPLSKRTSVWTGANYLQGDFNQAADQKLAEFVFGMTHKF